MKKRIIERLKVIEKTNAVKIIYAVESGSRAWGFSSPDSDFDVRFIYINRPQWYLSVQNRADTINIMEDGNMLDFAGWDLKKALGLLLKSNMSLYEWLQSPIVYISTTEGKAFKKIAAKTWDKKKLIFSYCSLARTSYKSFIAENAKVKAKKYLYVLRTLAACQWLETKQSLPPITMDTLSESFKDLNEYIAGFSDWLISTKKLGTETQNISADKKANKWIAAQIEHYIKYANAMEDKEQNTAALDEYLYKTVRSQM